MPDDLYRLTLFLLHRLVVPPFRPFPFSAFLPEKGVMRFAGRS